MKPPASGFRVIYACIYETAGQRAYMLKVSKRRPRSQPKREGDEEGQMISTMRKVREKMKRGNPHVCMYAYMGPKPVRVGVGLNQLETPPAGGLARDGTPNHG